MKSPQIGTQQYELRHVLRRRLIIIMVSCWPAARAHRLICSKPHFIGQALAQNSPAQTMTGSPSVLGLAAPDQRGGQFARRARRGCDHRNRGFGARSSLQIGRRSQGGRVLVQLNADSDLAQLHSLKAAADLAQVTLTRDQVQLAAAGDQPGAGRRRRRRFEEQARAGRSRRRRSYKKTFARRLPDGSASRTSTPAST